LGLALESCDDSSGLLLGYDETEKREVDKKLRDE